jgi:hypothetical protein
MEAEEVTPTTLAAEAAQALQGVTDLIARLNDGGKLTWGDRWQAAAIRAGGKP